MIETQDIHIIYSFPGSESFSISKGRVGSSNSELGKWIIRPFNKTTKPIEISILETEEFESIPDLNLRSSVEDSDGSRKDYNESIGQCIEFAKRRDGKVILSRTKTLQGKVDIAETLEGLRTSYPNAFVYLFHGDGIGTWIGATPEILLEARDGFCRTYALAGTKWGDDLFTQKEFDEQLLVVKDIAASLDDKELEVGDLAESSYGKLRHLKTEINWYEEGSLLKLAERIHPTAAVNGFPRKEASELIAGVEKHDREFYTGYLGFISDDANANLFVNLRCMQLFRDSVKLYAGGGINAKSDPEVEWEECERKFNSIEEAIKFDD